MERARGFPISPLARHESAMPGLAKSSRKGLRRFTAPLPAKVKAPLIDKPRPQPADHRTHRFGALSETIKQAPPALDASEIAIAKISAKLRRPDEAPKSTPKRHPIPDQISRQKIERTTDDNDGAQRGVGAAPLRRERGLRRGERLPGLTPDHCPRANVGEGLVTAARMVRSRLHGLRGLRASVLAGMPHRAWARRPWPTSRPASEPITSRFAVKARPLGVMGLTSAARRRPTGLASPRPCRSRWRRPSGIML
jgi:hypothetical protein